MKTVKEFNETSDSPRAIVGVDKETVHRICSGQVVLDLATAVKELVENSVDAGASNIEVRLKEHGTQLIEVIDNGCGVKEIDFSGLTTKHATSKLSTFTDLMSVQTFGFRGEALSSLCALGQVTVSTRHVSSEIGTLLEFDTNGKIVYQKKQARSIGTTVSVKDIFSSLPVRRKEFLRNTRREFNKMIFILQAYCVISTGIRVSCVDIKANGNRVSILTTNGNKSIKENIVDVFGPKQTQTLEEIQWTEDESMSEDVMAEFNIRKGNERPLFSLSGFVSSCVHGKGRNSNDRQFYFVNGRPCEPTKLAKTVNDTYHMFNRHQSPFICLNIETKRDEVDVNITPDKRQVFFENEKFLLATVKSALLRIYESAPATFEVHTPKFIEEWKKDCSLVVDKIEPSKNLVTLANLRQNFTADGTSSPTCSYPSHSKKRKLSAADSAEAKQPSMARYLTCPKMEDTVSLEVKPKIEIPVFEASVVQPSESMQNESGVICDHELEKEKTTTRKSPEVKHTVISYSKNSEVHEGKRAVIELSARDEDPSPCSNQCVKVNDTAQCEISEMESDISEPLTRVWEDFSDKSFRIKKDVSFSIENLRSTLDMKKQETEKSEKNIFRKFLAKISPGDNDTAEEELRKEFRKEDFTNMKIFGQFNLGFIIAAKGDDLFIIDQHATDEKFNFERLQNAQDTEIMTQRLVVRQNLELPAMSEDIVMENLEMFRANGFEFEIEPEAPPTQRVYLTQIPHSKNWTFGKQDVEELIFMLTEDGARTSKLNSKTIFRPSRVRAMFASRACRTSVMIGTALSNYQMRKLVDHMSQMESPWNCPHGRPTMRHLINLNLIQSTD